MASRDIRNWKLQRNLVIWAVIVALLSGMVGGIYSLIEYRNVTNHFARSEQLSDKEDFVGASKSLEFAKRSWLVKHLGIKDSSIKVLSTEIKTRRGDQSIFQVGMEIGNNGDWDEGITRLLEIPSDSFYHQKAQIAIEQLKIKMLNKELGIEQTNRQTAENEIDRQILAINLLQSALEKETVEKLKAESATQAAIEIADRERTDKEESQREATSETARADREETAKLQAQANTIEQQRRAEHEEAAKLQAQANTIEQQQRAEREEKARIEELAVTNPLIQGIVAGELKFYFETLPPFAGTGVFSAVEDISSSLSSWTPYGTTIRRVYKPNGADLTVSWVKNYGSHTIGESIYRAHIKVGLGADNCLGDWMAFDASTVKKVLWHEIGHSMGYGHSGNPSNVMYRETDTKFVLEQVAADVLSGGWYMTFPLCNGGSYWYSFESDDSYKDFDLYVLPPGVEAASISLGEALGYTDCGKANMVRYTNSCDVQVGAIIFVANRSLYDAVRLSGEIISLDEPAWPNMEWDQDAFQYDDGQLNYYWDLFH